jgi:hypothetical protein
MIVFPNCDKCKSIALAYQAYRCKCGTLYDITRIYELCIKNSFEIVTFNEVALKSILHQGNWVRSSHIDHVDINIPGIIVEDDPCLLIDGFHRATRCIRDSIPFLCY